MTCVHLTFAIYKSDQRGSTC